jgi:hypothetical protein
MDWATDKPKDETNLKEDIQLQFYYYCLQKCFPEVECIIFNLYFIKLSKAFTVVFDKSDVPGIAKMIRENYERLTRITDPSWIVGTPISWKCRACPHSKTLEKNGETTCRFFKRQLSSMGYDRTMAAFCDWDNLSAYGQGGSANRK